MNYILLVCFLISFFTVLFAVPLWIKKAKINDIVGRDIHKPDGRKIAEMGGVTVIVGFMFGILSYLAITTYYTFIESNHLITLGILCTLLITTIIGIMDDMLGWKIGLRQYQKPLLTIVAAIPIAILFKDVSSLNIPFIGVINFGFLYSILIIPAVILISTNAFNMLAGYNGLEAGMGVIMLGALGILALANGQYWAGVISFIMVFALLAFLSYNHYPAQIFPGDSLTYSVGALIGIIAVVSSQIRVVFILFIPYLFEFVLKLRGKFQKQSFSKVNTDGGLYIDGFKEIFGLEHLAVYLLSKFKKKVIEPNVVWSLWLMEIVFVLIAVVMVV